MYSSASYDTALPRIGTSTRQVGLIRHLFLLLCLSTDGLGCSFKSSGTLLYINPRIRLGKPDSHNLIEASQILNLMLRGEEPTTVDRYIYCGGCASNNGSEAVEVNARISKVRAVHAKRKHSWRQPDICLRF